MTANRRTGTTILALAAGATIIAALAIPPAASLAAGTGSVYWDAPNHNVAAGRYFFGGFSPYGFANVGLGYSVMPALTTGNYNVAIGDGALFTDSSGGDNVATGANALGSNTTGGD